MVPSTTLDCYSDFWCSEAVKPCDRECGEDTSVRPGKQKINYKAGVFRALLNEGKKKKKTVVQSEDEVRYS